MLPLRSPYGLAPILPTTGDGLGICKDESAVPAVTAGGRGSARWWKRQCHADLLGASRGSDAGFHCGLLREHFAHVGPPLSFAGKYFWLHGEIKAVLQYAISNLDGLTFLFLWSMDQIYSILKMFLVLSEGEAVFLLLASACLSHLYAK